MSYFFKNIQFLAELNKTSNESFLKNTGISLSHIQQEVIHPTPEELIKISEFYNLPIDTFLKQNLNEKHKHKKEIKLLILDVDGVMTDGGMYYTEEGDEFKKFNTKDGMAIKNLAKKGLPIGIISSGFNAKLIKRRALLLGIEHVYVGKESKIDILTKWCKELNIEIENVAFIGDDINDEGVMKAVGLSACPANAVNSIKYIASIILKRKGGDACIREFIDEWM